MSGAILLAVITLARESRDFYQASTALTEDPAIYSKMRERFLITASFVLTPNQDSRDLSKETNFETSMPPGNSHLNLCLRTGKVTAVEVRKM